MAHKPSQSTLPTTVLSRTVPSHAGDKPRTFFLTYWLLYLKDSSGCPPFSILHVSTETPLPYAPNPEGTPSGHSQRNPSDKLPISV